MAGGGGVRVSGKELGHLHSPRAKLKCRHLPAVSRVCPSPLSRETCYLRMPEFVYASQNSSQSGSEWMQQKGSVMAAVLFSLHPMKPEMQLAKKIDVKQRKTSDSHRTVSTCCSMTRLYDCRVAVSSCIMPGQWYYCIDFQDIILCWLSHLSPGRSGPGRLQTPPVGPLWLSDQDSLNRLRKRQLWLLVQYKKIQKKHASSPMLTSICTFMTNGFNPPPSHWHFNSIWFKCCDIWHMSLKSLA